LSEAPGNDSVQHIGETGCNEDQECEAVPIIRKQDDENRYEDDPQYRELVRRC
jgi:hypothetical protein